MRSETEVGVKFYAESEVPTQISDAEILSFLSKKKINWSYVDAIKKISHENDQVISGWLNMSRESLYSYKNVGSKFEANLEEHILLLLLLIRHGNKVFSDAGKFKLWLNTKNFYFDNNNPADYIHTITGIRFIDERLTAMEFGDNI